MTFIVNGIKEGFDKKYNIEFVINIDSILLAKKFLENTGIIVLSLKEYKEQPNIFGNISFTIHCVEQDISVYTKFEGDLIQACDFFLMIGFDIKYINFTSNPLTTEEVVKIVENSKENNEKKREEQKIIAEKKEDVEKKIFEDPRLGSDKKVIERIFAKVEKVIKLTTGFIAGKDLKKIKEKEDELKKLKLGTNHERIVELTEEMTTLLESMETDFYNANTDKEKKIFEDSIVTDIDITKELNKIDKIEQIKSVGGKIKSTEQDYQVFGKSFLFLKILYKDFIYLFKTPQHLTNMLYNTYDLVELGIIVILVQVSIYILANTIFVFSTNSNYEYFYTIYIKIGLIWILLFCARYLRLQSSKTGKKNIPILIVLIPAIIILYYILLSIINNNFSI